RSPGRSSPSPQHPRATTRGVSGAGALLAVRSGLLAGDVDEVPEREVDVAQVETPVGRQGAAGLIARCVLLADVGDLEPGEAVGLLTLRAVQLRVRDPRRRRGGGSTGGGADGSGKRLRAQVRLQRP